MESVLGAACPKALRARSTDGLVAARASARAEADSSRVVPACMSDWEAHELHSTPMSPKDGDEGGVLLGLVQKLLAESKVLAEADLDDDEVAVPAVEEGWVGVLDVGDSSGVDEIGAAPVLS